MRVAIIYRPRSAAPPEIAPVLMAALGQWAETYGERFSTFEFFVAGGGLIVADFDDSNELQRVVAENPFTPYMDIEISPSLAPSAAMETWSQVVASLSG